MAVSRPWVTPDEVREYTDREEVKERTDAKLKVDITRAEQKVLSITHNPFSDEEDTELPEPVKIAVLICAEAYAKNSIEQSGKQIKSETFDDYSYSLESGTVDLDSLDLYELLKDYILDEPDGKVFLRMRAI